MNVKYLLASVLVLGQSALADELQTPAQEPVMMEVAEPEVNIVKIIDFTGTREQVEQVFQASPSPETIASQAVKSLETSQAETNQKSVQQSRTLNRAYSYTVRGKQYHAMKDAKGFEQYGKASWYGPGFHGRKTANGERYDMHDLTAAHKELPLGSKVEVTNTANGRKVVVRINDRGPFHGNRVLDLSKAAADKLGVLQQGVANVHIRVIQ
ncbi:MAG: septal ring lytic transglycosylase RlpA family protein [Cardiobacteriaceae bacterium]|nr:septal ring lytic transglycosylase RlpA family protein [Cardiobacteriaceae bacterium]